MKKILTGTKLQEKMQESINLLCDIVGSTLGPKGSNVIIDHSLFTPFITNDGATIAKNIESDDEVVNTILEIAKEASLKTNEVVGDGTTTTLVLLKSIFNTSLKYIEKGKNPILLKKELSIQLENIVKKIEQEKRIPNENDLLHIASVATNDQELGKIAKEAFFKVQNKNAITIKEMEENQLDILFTKGYILNTELVSDYFLKEQKSIEMEQACVLIVHDYLENLENISFILNDCMQKKRNLVIFANEYNENVLREMISLHLENELNCCILKIAEYGMHQRNLEKDLEILTDAKIIENYNFITKDAIGFVRHLNITKDTICFDFIENTKIKNYVSSLEKEVKEYKDEYEQVFLEKRIAMFKHGLATIYIGAPTKTECHEMKMRLEDALCALESCKTGVLPGCGITLLKIASGIVPKTDAEAIFKESLKMPFIKILSNAGLDSISFIETIKKENFQKIYNVKQEKMETIENTSILDSLNVVTTSIINATSIATMLLTTTSLVINEYANTMNKTNEYTEM